MSKTRLRCGQHHPRGFTLVEMLVVIMIILLVTTLTLAAMRFTVTGDRVRAGARQVQSMIEGARNRAVYAKEERGVRLLLDAMRDQTGSPGSPGRRHVVSSMVYIAPSENWAEGKIVMQRVDNDADDVADAPEVRIVRGLGTGWYALAQRGLLIHGRSRIRIPAGPDGHWYPVLLNRLGPTSEMLELATDYRRAGNTPPSDVLAFTGGGPTDYELELPPAPLPNQEPVLLPGGVVIDLDVSDLPAQWRGGTEYPPHMDLMFSPRGTVTGTAVAKGVVHFVLCGREDSDLLRIARDATTGRMVLGPEIGETLLVTLFAGTGNVSSHPLDVTDADTDGQVDDPYRFAELGAVAGR